MEPFKDVMEMRRALWQRVQAYERFSHAVKEWSEIDNAYKDRFNDALKDEQFFVAYIEDALDRHLVWNLHRNGKNLELTLIDGKLSQSIPLSWQRFELMRAALEARGFGVEI